MMRILTAQMGSFALPLTFVFQVYLLMTLSSFLVIFHLSYYVIAYYFRLLKATTFAEPIDDDETGQKENYGDDFGGGEYDDFM